MATTDTESNEEQSLQDAADQRIIEYNDRTSAHYWERWIKAAEKAAENHWDDARDAWCEYEWKERKDARIVDRDATKSTRAYPIYWASCKVLEPALYARTPKVTTRRRFDIHDEVALTSCVIVERLGEYLLECCEFDSAMMAAVQDFINADKASVQLVYESKKELVTERLPVVPYQSPDGAVAYLNMSDGQPVDESLRILQDEQGFYAETEEEKEVDKKIKIIPLCFDDVLHTPSAKSENEITEQAYRFSITYAEAKEAFGEEVAKKINWKTRNDRDKSDEHALNDEDKTENLELVCEGWEIYDYLEERVLWYTDQHNDKLVKNSDDIYGLHEFFPSPKFIINNKPSKTMYPRPAYKYLEAAINQLHENQTKVHSLIDGIRRRCLVDGASPELLNALNKLSDNEYIAVDNLQSIIEKGGINGMLYWVPVQELVAAIAELQQLTEKFKGEFFEWFGVPDILRGQTDPIEAEGTQRIKQQAAHDRFKFIKKQVQQLARDAIELMIDLALQKYDDEEMAQIVGAPYMSQTQQAAFPAALELIRNDTTRMIRVDIETDSMTFVDEGMRAFHTQQAVQTMIAGMEQVANMSQIDTAFGHVALQGLLRSLASLGTGKEFESEVKQAAQGLLEKLKNPPEPPPPPPDYEGQRLMLDAQQQKLDNEVKHRELERKEMEAIQKTQNQALEGQLKAQQTQLEELLGMWGMQVEAHQMQMEEMRVATEQFKAEGQEAERKMEEIRLAREADAEIFEGMMRLQEQTNQTQEKMQSAPVTINIAVPKQRQRKAQVIFDEMGNAQLIADEPEILEEQIVTQQVQPGGSLVMPPVQSRSGQVNFQEDGNASIVVDELIKDMDNE